MSESRNLWTVGRIASRLDEPLHRIEYAIKTRGITPLATAGNARIFDEGRIDDIAAALRDIDSRGDANPSRATRRLR